MSAQSMPGFNESLRLLVERERYSFHDIGLMFGVTRERVRQWCAIRGIGHPVARGGRGLHAIRVWDDVAHRFQPVSRDALRAERLAGRRKQHHAEVQSRRGRIVAAIVGLRAQYGREPTWREVATELGCQGRAVLSGNYAAAVVALWGRHGSDTARALADIRSATGFAPAWTRYTPRAPRAALGASSPEDQK